MKLTQKIIDDLEKALDMRKKNGDPVWDGGDEIDVCLGGTFANDKFISLINRPERSISLKKLGNLCITNFDPNP